MINREGMDPEVRAYLDSLEAANSVLTAKLASGRGRKLSFKVSPKGAASVYGMGKWPVTLYKEQWLRLFDEIPALTAFLDAHADVLTTKADAEIAAAVAEAK